MRCHVDNNDFKCLWLTDVDEIDDKEWISVFGKKYIKSRIFFKSIQQSGIEGVEFHYFLITENSKTVAIAPGFYFRLDLIGLLNPSKFKDILLKLRGIFPKFLKIRTLVIGSYASSCEYFIGIRNTYEDNREAISFLVRKHLKEKAKTLKARLTLIKEIRETQIGEAKASLGAEFSFIKSFPTAFVPTFTECRPYPAALKPSHQRRYRKMTKEYDESNAWEITADIAPYKDTFEEMYLNVLCKAKNKLEVLNGEFFVNLNRNLAGNTFVVISRDKTGKIRSMALVIEEEDRLVPLYLGMSYGDGDARGFYINLLFKIIGLSEQKDKKIVEFGQTSYYPKIMSGAFTESIYYGVSSYHPLVCGFLRSISRLGLFDVELLPHVYRKEKADTVISKSEYEYGFKVCNL